MINAAPQNVFFDKKDGKAMLDEQETPLRALFARLRHDGVSRH